MSRSLTRHTTSGYWSGYRFSKSDTALVFFINNITPSHAHTVITSGELVPNGDTLRLVAITSRAFVLADLDIRPHYYKERYGVHYDEIVL